MSLEEKFSGDLSKALDEVRKVVNDSYKDEEEVARSCAERSIRLGKISDDLLNMLKSRQDETLRKSDLVLLSSVISVQSEIQSELAVMNVQRIRDLEDVFFLVFKVSLTIAVKILSRLVEAIPEVMAKDRNAVKEELGKLYHEIGQMKSQKEEIKVEIPEKFEATFRWLENKMKTEKEEKKKRRR